MGIFSKEGLESLLAKVLKSLSINPVPLPRPPDQTVTDGICVDFSRAFDFVPHGLLIKPKRNRPPPPSSEVARRGRHIGFRILSAAQRPRLGLPRKGCDAEPVTWPFSFSGLAGHPREVGRAEQGERSQAHDKGHPGDVVSWDNGGTDLLPSELGNWSKTEQKMWLSGDQALQAAGKTREGRGPGDFVTSTVSFLFFFSFLFFLFNILFYFIILFYLFCFVLFYFILFYLLFRATPKAYGSLQARGPIGAAAASLHHSHSSTGSEPYLRPTPQLMGAPDP